MRRAITFGVGLAITLLNLEIITIITVINQKIWNHKFYFFSVLTLALTFPSASPAFAGGAANVLSLISLLADVKELTSGLTINQTAADTICTVTVIGIIPFF